MTQGEPRCLGRLALDEAHFHQICTQGGWAAAGERAAAHVDQILQARQPEPLPDDVKWHLSEIVARASA